MPRTLNDEDMARVTVRVPIETRDELYRLADVAGLKAPHFMAAGLVIGCRQLVRQAAPEYFVTARLVEAMIEAMGVDVEQMKARFGEQYNALMAETIQEEQEEVAAERERRKTA